MATKRVTLFDVEDGGLFEWNGETYQLIRLEDDNGIVRYWDEKKSQHEQNFNPYAEVIVVD